MNVLLCKAEKYLHQNNRSFQALFCSWYKEADCYSFLKYQEAALEIPGVVSLEKRPFTFFIELRDCKIEVKFSRLASGYEQHNTIIE